MLATTELSTASGSAVLEGFASVLMAAAPYLLASEATVRHEVGRSPHALVTIDGAPVGVGRIRDHVAEDGTCSVLLAVLPDVRGRGAGTALLRWALARCSALGASRLTGVVDEDGRSPDVAVHWGFTIGAASRMSWVDSRTVQPFRGRVDAGLTLVPLEEVGPERVWECHNAAAPDDPSGFSRSMTLAEYQEEEWDDPLLRHDLSRGVLEGDRCVAFSLVRAAAGRGWSSMTAVTPTHRGRGLALMVKTAALRAAADAGVHWCGTANSAANAAVLAVNARLGYQPLSTVRAVSLELTPASGR